MCGPGFLAPLAALGGGGAAAGAAATGTGLFGGLSTVLTGVGGAISAFGALQNARVAKEQARRNAARQERAAIEAIEAGQEASDRKRRQVAAARGQQSARMAANGIDVTGGDALSVLDETAQFGAEDAFAIREDARRQADGLFQGAANSITQGNVDAANARSGAFRTILGTGTRIGRKYSHWATESAYT